MERLSRDSRDQMEKLVYVEASGMVKDDKIAELEARLVIYDHVDLIKYRDLTSDLRRTTK